MGVIPLERKIWYTATNDPSWIYTAGYDIVTVRSNLIKFHGA